MNFHINDNFRLTTEHSQSSYGLPVLVDAAGQSYGAADTVSTGEGKGLAADLVRAWAMLPERVEAEIKAARLFLGQYPAGPQLPCIEEVIG